MATVKLISSDKKSFDVDVKAAYFSKLIKEELLKQFEKEAQEISIDEVRGVILQKIIEWVDYHKNDPGAESGAYVKSDWDVNFLKQAENKSEMLFELVGASSLLGIKGLFDLTCGALKLVNDKEGSEIREAFGGKR